jgi:hypothetical protein
MANGFLGWAGQAVSLVYRDTLGRTRLLRQLLRKRHHHDVAFDDVLAANAEPTPLPEPLLRTKVG